MKNLILAVSLFAPNVAFCMSNSNSTLYIASIDDGNEITLKKVRRSAEKKECDSYQLACQEGFPLPTEELHGTMSSGSAGHLYTFKSNAGDKRGKYIAIVDPDWDLYSVIRRLGDDELEKLLTERALQIRSIKGLQKRRNLRKDNIRRLGLSEDIEAPRASDISTLDWGSEDSGYETDGSGSNSSSTSSWSLPSEINVEEGQDGAEVEEAQGGSAGSAQSGSSWLGWFFSPKR